MASSATYAGLAAGLNYYLNKRDKARALDEEKERELEKEKREDERWLKRQGIVQEMQQENLAMSDILQKRRFEAEQEAINAGKELGRSYDKTSGKTKVTFRSGETQEFDDPSSGQALKDKEDAASRANRALDLQERSVTSGEERNKQARATGLTNTANEMEKKALLVASRLGDQSLANKMQSMVSNVKQLIRSGEFEQADSLINQMYSIVEPRYNDLTMQDKVEYTRQTSAARDSFSGGF